MTSMMRLNRHSDHLEAIDRGSTSNLKSQDWVEKAGAR